MIRVSFGIFSLVWMAGGSALADVKQIGWADLIPESAPLEDPLHQIDLDVRQDLARLARVKADVSQGFLAEDSDAMIEADALIERRLAQGIDLRALEQAVAEHGVELSRRQEMINTALDGELVRIPGYALPLEYAADGVTELFLVPFVGACIHVPPPPPNQIVSVSLKDPLMFDGLFQPVWVTGRMKAEGSSRPLTLVDGSADIPYGYSLTDVRIEPYR